MDRQQMLDLFCIGGQFLVDRQDHSLDRGQPQGEFACKMFHKNTEEPFHGTVDHPVDHDGPMLFIVRAFVCQVKTFRQRHVQLNCAALPGSAQSVLDVDVYLGTVKGTIPFIDHKFLAIGLYGIAQSVGGGFPLFIRAD